MTAISEISDPWVRKQDAAVRLIDAQLLNLPQSNLMKVDEVHDMLLDLRNEFSKEG